MFRPLIAATTLAFSVTAAADGWYARGFGGYSELGDFSFDGNAGRIESTFDGGFNLGGAVGFDTHWLAAWADSHGLGSRFEMEYAYREDGVDDHRLGGARLPASDGDFDAHTLMANALVDFNKQGALGFYAGGGLGVAFASLDGFEAAGADVFDDDDTVFAWQGIVGAEYRLDPRWSVFGEYRYVGMLDPEVRLFPAFGGAAEDVGIDTHNVNAGIRYRF